MSDLYQQMADLGLLDEQDAGYSQQIRQAQAMRQRPRYQGADGMSAAIGGLGDIINTYGSQQREQQASEQQQALRANRSQTRQAGAQAFANLPTIDMEPWLAAKDDASAAEARKTMDAALQEREAAANAGIASGDSAFQKLGMDTLNDVQHRRDTFNQPGARLKLAKERADLEAQEQRRTNLAVPGTPASVLRLALARSVGMQPPEGAAGRDIDDAELKDATQLQMHRDMARAAAARLDLTHGEKQTQADAKREDAAVKEMSKLLDPYRRTGGLGNYMDVVNRVKQIRGQVIDPNTGQLKDTLTNNHMAELAITLQQAVSNGHAAAGQVEHLIPHTASGSVAQALTYLTAHPWDAGQKAIAAQMLEQAENAGDKAAESVQDAIIARVPAQLNVLRKLNPKRANIMLKAAGLNPDSYDDDGELIEGADPILRKGRSPLNDPSRNKAPGEAGASGTPPGMKKQVNSKTGEFRYVPDGR